MVHFADKPGAVLNYFKLLYLRKAYALNPKCLEMKKRTFTELKSQLTKIFWITVAWTIISVQQFLVGYLTLRDFGCLNGVDPSVFFYGSILTGVAAGVIGGSGVVFLWEKWLRSKDYGRALLYIFFSYTGIFLIVTFVNDLYFSVQYPGLSIFSFTVWDKALSNLLNIDIHSFLLWLVVVLGTLIVLQVNDKYGPGVFGAFLLGRYFQPKREERIFMFLDLRSSTTIAEKLGEERYFNFIRNVFKDVTPAILRTKGEIYQYVGDEIVISWKMNYGTKNANCLQCFFQVQSVLLDKRKYYEKNYDDIYPEFKAGIHYGHVMAGEVGVVKRDIVFSGDVLNTTARIQSKCNELGVNVLLSKFLLDKLSLKSNKITTQKMGDMLLRGKKEKVSLYTLLQ